MAKKRSTPRDSEFHSAFTSPSQQEEPERPQPLPSESSWSCLNSGGMSGLFPMFDPDSYATYFQNFPVGDSEMMMGDDGDEDPLSFLMDYIDEAPAADCGRDGYQDSARDKEQLVVAPQLPDSLSLPAPQRTSYSSSHHYYPPSMATLDAAGAATHASFPTAPLQKPQPLQNVMSAPPKATFLPQPAALYRPRSNDIRPPPASGVVHTQTPTHITRTSHHRPDPLTQADSAQPLIPTIDEVVGKKPPISGTNTTVTRDVRNMEPIPTKLNDRNNTHRPLDTVTSSTITPIVVSSSDTDGSDAIHRTKWMKPMTRTDPISSSSSSSSSSPPLKKTRVDKTTKTLEKIQTTDPNLDEFLLEEDRNVSNRERNREHARNTRLRKKAYVENLKKTLDDLCKERDALIVERAEAAKTLVESNESRIQVLLSFFALRATCEKRRNILASIMDENISCVFPITPYRSFPASEVQVSKCQRTIMGIDGMIADASSLQVLLNSLVDRARFPEGVVHYQYEVIAEEAVSADNLMMIRWSFNTTNLVRLGARRDIQKMGMLSARFNSSHKIMAMELMFDVMAFMLQLKQCTGNHEFAIVPNTIQTCQGFQSIPMVITMAERPYTIIQVNRAWEIMTGWLAEDVVGKASCKILQGPRTDVTEVEKLMTEILFKRPARCSLLNYSRGMGQLFRNFFNLYPLSTDSKVTHYVGFTIHFEKMYGENYLDSDLIQSNSSSSLNIEEVSSVVSTSTEQGNEKTQQTSKQFS